MKEIEKVISSIRNSHPDMEKLYMEGQCYNFHLILKSIFPSAEAWYNQVEGHVYSRIDGHFYDIRGKHYQLKNFSSVLCHKNGHRPHRWGLGDRKRFELVDHSIKIKRRLPQFLCKISSFIRKITINNNKVC